MIARYFCNFGRLTVRLSIVTVCATGIWSAIAFAAPVAAVTPQEKLLSGERMYRQGILPSGEPLQAVVKGDIPVSGTAFTCVSCHLRSGLGSTEGGVVTTPTNGQTLYSPLDIKYKSIRVEDKYYPVTSHRPAYDDESLAWALRGGVDPAGREMNPVMPRYLLEDADMALMISYLKTLSTDPQPGVTDRQLHFATIITEDVPKELSDAFVSSLESYVRFKNNMADYYTKNKRGGRMAAAMLRHCDVEYLKFSLSKWVLKGAPVTWRAQLEEYYRKDPVFAILGGISAGEWQPMHDFSEAKKIPTLFPLTDYPVISEKDWYTLYFSKGVYQEGESAARYLNTLENIKGKPVIQIVRNAPKGQRLAKGFDDTWQELGHSRALTIHLDAKESLSPEKLKQIIAEQHPAALFVWDDPAAIPALNSLATISKGPEYIFVSSSYLGGAISSFDDAARDSIYIMYPFSLPKIEASKKVPLKQLTGDRVFKGEAENVVKKVYNLTNILSLALMDMRGNYYSDYLFDVIGMQADQPVPVSGMQSAQPVPLFERLSFGPGQRYASKGCYVVQLTKGVDPQLVKKSDWVIY